VDFEAACSVYIRFRGVNGYRGQVTPGNWTGPQGCGAGSYGPLHDGHGTPVGLGESRIGRKSRGQVDRVQQAPVVDHRRAGLLAIRAASGAPVLPVGEPPIREREPAGDDEPAGFGLGNRLRRWGTGHGDLGSVTPPQSHADDHGGELPTAWEAQEWIDPIEVDKRRPRTDPARNGGENQERARQRRR